MAFAPSHINLRQWTYKELIHKAVTRSPHTTDFRHMHPFPRAWSKRNTWADSNVKAVRAHLRIKYWNIVPGDRIGIRGNDERTVHEVLSINKVQNRVFLKNTISAQSSVGRPPVSQSVHYSRCQLFLRDYELTTQDGQTETVPVFAKRLATTQPIWRHGRFQWNRIAVMSNPVIPDFARESIPWPAPEAKPPTPAPNAALDTLEADLQALTFVPPVVGSIPGPEVESAYLSKIYNKDAEDYVQAPLEVFLTKELSNVHSRAKKMARFTAYKRYEQDLLGVYIKNELANLDGRTIRDAKAEAQFKWREAILAEKKADKKRRWLNVARVEKIARRTDSKKQKEERQRRALTNMVLEGAKNQFIPPTTS